MAKLPTDQAISAAPLGEPTPDDNEAGESPEVSLSPDQMTQAGLSDLAEGDTFTVTITATVTSSDPDKGIEADITDASEGEKQDGEAEPGGSEDEPPFVKPKSSIQSPKEAGF